MLRQQLTVIFGRIGFLGQGCDYIVLLGKLLLAAIFSQQERNQGDEEAQCRETTDRDPSDLAPCQWPRRD